MLCLSSYSSRPPRLIHSHLTFHSLYTPLIDKKNYNSWIRYSKEHVDWISESRSILLHTNEGKIGRVEGVHNFYRDEVTSDFNNTPVCDYIYRMDELEEFENHSVAKVDISGQMGPWVPVWQISPPPLNVSVMKRNSM